MYKSVLEIGSGGGKFRLDKSDRVSWSESGNETLGSIKCKNFLTS